MKKVTIILAAIVVAGSAFAQVTPMLGEGTRELRVNGDIGSDAGEFNVDLQGGAGYYIMDNVEVGVVGGIGLWDEMKTFYGGVFGEYNFPLQGLPIVPFAGARVSLLYWDYGDSHGGNMASTPDLDDYYDYLMSAVRGDETGDDSYGADDTDGTAFELVGYGGAKWYLLDQLALGAALEIKMATDDVYIGDGELESIDIELVFGTQFFF